MQNTFLERLGTFGFCVFVMLVVDLLHEFELGIWKAILSHLLRMLESLKGDKLCELDQRKANPIDKRFPTTQLTLFLSKVSSGPSFGRDTIRRFSKNTSEMKRVAARDFEDFLQVCGGPVPSGNPIEPSYTVLSSHFRRLNARAPQCCRAQAPPPPLSMARVCKATNAHQQNPSIVG